MKPILWRIWRFTRWPLAVLITLYVAIVIYSFPHALEKEKTEQTIARINAQKLTIEHVNGEHLPPPPDPAQVDATIEGVDANANGIRDDVELAIFERYPDSLKIRAAELQYAMALQMYLTEVFNSETLVAVILKDEHGDFCIAQTVSRAGLSGADKYVKEVESIVIDSTDRKSKYDYIFQNYMTSYAGKPGPYCDIDPSMLSN